VRAALVVTLDEPRARGQTFRSIPMHHARSLTGAYIFGGIGAYMTSVVLCVLSTRGFAGSTARVEAQDPGDPADATLRVPHASASIVLDGDTEDPGWTSAPGPARTGPFVQSNGAPGRPHSEARMVWGDGYLYVLLYAADDDIRSRASHVASEHDAFRLTFSRSGRGYSIEASPDGVVTDAARDRGGSLDPSWHSDAHVSCELDGTIDDGRDTDEEWSLEMAVPFASLGMKGERGESARFSVERCDAPKGGARACAGWGARNSGRIVIE
jgi:hypothetical protein